MEVKKILLTLQKHDIRLLLKEGKLISNAKKGKMTPEFRALIKENKEAIITWLRDHYSPKDIIPIAKERKNFPLYKPDSGS